MKEKLDRLTQVVQSELALGKRYLGLIEAKRKAIIANKIEDINRITREEHDTIQQFEETGYSRQDLVLEITRSEKLRETESFRDLIRQLPEQDAERFTELRERLLTTYREIAERSTTNGELLAQSIRVTQHLFQRYSSVDRRVRQGKSGYRPYGKPTRGAEPVVFKQQG